jgi:hypothetical protein
MVALSSPPAAAHAVRENLTQAEQAYQVFWRLRSSGPWRREEFDSRNEAYNRFFHLMRQGLNPRWRRV